MRSKFNFATWMYFVCGPNCEFSLKNSSLKRIRCVFGYFVANTKIVFRYDFFNSYQKKHASSIVTRNDIYNIYVISCDYAAREVLNILIKAFYL